MTITCLERGEQPSNRAACSEEFEVHLRGALGNPRMRDSLRSFQQGWRAARDHTTHQIDFDGSNGATTS